MKRNNLETKRLARTTFRTLMLIVFFLFFFFFFFFFVVSQHEATYRYDRIARVPYHSRTSRLTEKQFVERLRRLLKYIEILLPGFRRRDLVHGRAGEFSKKQRQRVHLGKPIDSAESTKPRESKDIIDTDNCSIGRHAE